MKKSNLKFVASITVIGIALIIVAIYICDYLKTDSDITVAVVGALAVIISGVINILPELLSSSSNRNKANVPVCEEKLSQKGSENELHVKGNEGALDVKQSGRNNKLRIEDNKN